ncbi:MAG: cytidylate kinase-like family protein [Prevotella sp.]|jgi:cytidylate kinase|nr:cytidylate kinase-like family protein [Prevotella sp.]MCI2080982.1 cytidylate kinase-like family protein [Prevotella sp.]MCI2102847.1 cytidylate kinase-like family protein [Prevotella sp.]HCN54405.1 cytidylate kinase [Prevotella sp.]
MNNPGIIINIGRQVGSGGRTIAKMLANDFGCKFYDKEILNLAAKESGFCEKFFEQHDEQKGFAQSLFHFHIPMMGDNNFYQNNFSQESLFQFQSDAIRKAAAAGNCVFVGRTADYILRDFDNTIDIFITAKIEDRIKTVGERHHLQPEQAKKYIHDKESERSSYYNYYTGKKWGDSSSYDLCVNSSLLGIEETETFLVEFIKKRFDLK